jgi:hypothetical protein
MFGSPTGVSKECAILYQFSNTAKQWKNKKSQYNQRIPHAMSYELINHSTIISRTFSKQFWAKALELAMSYGWRPMGTQPPSHLDFYKLEADWHGTYLTNDGQTVKAEDALLLACALERSLEDISDTNIKTDWNFEMSVEDDLPEWLSPEEREMIEEELQDGLLDMMGVHPFEYFAGDEKEHLKEFIRFCRLGSFEIL